MDKETKKTVKEELNSVFTDSYIKNAGTLLRESAKDFYERKHLEETVYFDDNIFKNMLIDLLIDLARLKPFHEIEYINYRKFNSYAASWILKRKPFQLIECKNNPNIYVNEVFALTLLLQSGGCYQDGMNYLEEDGKKIVNEIGEIFYHLKYRNTNPQTLELLLKGLDFGKMLVQI